MSKARQLADLGNVYDDGALSHRRMTYNGAMNVWQRGTSADTASNNDYMCDRWQVSFSGLDGNVDWDQETSSTPDGFANALKVSIDASETSLDAGDRIQVQQPLEGQDLQHIMKGTSSAKKLTVSFWVRSSVASTYTLELEDADNARFANKTYTVDTADTWEYKTIVFDGDTTGTFGNDNGASLYVTFWLDAGTNFTGGTFQSDWAAKASDKRIYDTTGWLESTSPTFYITGVQLEVGDTATPFEHRSYGDELARCQRYYEEVFMTGGNFIGYYASAPNRFYFPAIHYETRKRTSPTASFSTSNSYMVISGTVGVEASGQQSGFSLYATSDVLGVTKLRANGGGTPSSGYSYNWEPDIRFYLDAEL